MEIPIGLNLPDQAYADPLGQSLENTIVSPLGIKIRPGATDLVDLTSAASVDGIYDWQEQELVIAVSDGSVYRLTNDALVAGGGTSYLLLESGDRLLLEDGGKMIIEATASVADVSGAVEMASGNRVIFANYGDYLYMANGGKIQELHPTTSLVTHGGHDYQAILNSINIEPGVDPATATYWSDLGVGTSYDAWDADTRYGSGTADVLEDADAPTTVSWIAVADSYLLALEDDTELLWWSYPASPWRWDADFASAEYLPDTVNTMRVANSDLYIGGKRSIQVFQNDGITPWVPSVYGALSCGVIAPYSFVYCPDIESFVWIDDNRRLVKLTGRQVVPLNHALDTVLNTISRVSDAVADYVIIYGVPYYIIHFPESDASYIVNLSNNTYAEWSTGENRWIGNCIINVPNWDMIVIGDKSDGLLKKIGTVYSDDAGDSFTTLIRSPRIPSGNSQTAPRLMIHFNRIVSASDAGTASLSVRWRDDGKDWVTARTMTLDDIQDTDFIRSLYRLGHYRQYRQYEFDCSNLWPFSIAKVEQV